MPTFELHVINSDFNACQDLDARTVEEAMQRGLRAALQIGTDEICRGKPFFGAEVLVRDDGETRARMMISLGQSPLK